MECYDTIAEAKAMRRLRSLVSLEYGNQGSRVVAYRDPGNVPQTNFNEHAANRRIGLNLYRASPWAHRAFWMVPDRPGVRRPERINSDDSFRT